VEDGLELPRTTGDYHFTDAVTDHAVQYISEQDDDPYFLYVAYSSPHFPLHAREEDIARYRGKFIEGWDELSEERYARMVELGIIDPSWPRPTERDPQELPWEEIHPEYRAWFDERMAVYAAMIEQTDRGIGKIMAAVEARGELENTIVIFLSDNGACAEEIGPICQGGGCFPETRDGLPVRYGNNPTISPGPEDTYQSVGLEWAGFSNTPFRRYKSFTHEGGIATPLIVSWPSKINPGIVREQGHIIDIMPTFLALAGAQYPTEYNGNAIQPMAGRSLIPLFQGGTRPETVYIWEHEGNEAIRAGDWKLVRRLGTEWELHNMNTDRLEAVDLADEMPERVASLVALYDSWAARTGILPARGGQTAIGVADPTIYSRYPWAPTGYPWDQGGRGGGGGQGGRGGGAGGQ
jgi:arylsulfatase